VLAGEGDGQIFDLLNKEIRQISVPALKRNISPFNDLKTLFVLRKLYKQYRPDIIHLHSSKAGVLGRLAFPPAKIVYTVHGFDSIRRVYRKFLPLERLLQYRCRAIAAVSHYDVKTLREEGITHNVFCVPNGVNPRKKTPKPLNLPPHFKKKILCIARVPAPEKKLKKGRTAFVKRFDLFFKTAQLLPEYAFIWIGNQKPLKNSPPNIFCLGVLPHAESYNQLADVFMLPTNYEGMPMSVLEAQYFGLPVVASNVSGLGELVINDKNGYTVKNTATAFAEKIKYILEHPAIHQKFSRNAKLHFQKNFTIERMTAAYSKIYNLI
jgi:glycosyltransferase involved in cell wall biosynthesis